MKLKDILTDKPINGKDLDDILDKCKSEKEGYSSLADRMKDKYEKQYSIHLTKKQPVIIRLDGKAFHTFTKGFKKPFDAVLSVSMEETAKYLCKNISGCKLAYTQSDEISLLLVDYDKENTQPWFDNSLQKLVSVSSGMATMAFNKYLEKHINEYLNSLMAMQDFDVKVEKEYKNTLNKAREKGAVFDARAFNIPKEEVCNYFIWRQNDAIRNSIQMVAQSLYPYHKLKGKNCDDLIYCMLTEKGINWHGAFSNRDKFGICIYKVEKNKKATNLQTGEPVEVIRRVWEVDYNTPNFTKNREYIDKHVYYN